MTVHDNAERSAYPVYMQYDQPEPMSVLIRNTTISGGHGEVYVGDAVTLTADHDDFYRPGEDVQVHAGGRDYTAAELRDGSLGGGIISADPRFVAPAWGAPGDYHVTAGSPLIDAGTALGAPALDLDGATRQVGAAVDIGAYEYGAPAPALVLTAVDPPAAAAGATVTLRGSGFGATQGGSSVWFGTTQAAACPLWSNEVLEATVPPGVAGRIPVVVRVRGAQSGSVQFDVLPVIARLSPRRS